MRPPYATLKLHFLKPALRPAAAATLCSLILGGSAHAMTPCGGIEKIRHVVIIMQENRSFDSYFGTFPGADGIPMRDGVPQVCVPDRRGAACVRPYHDTHDENSGA